MKGERGKAYSLFIISFVDLSETFPACSTVVLHWLYKVSSRLVKRGAVYKTELTLSSILQ